MRYRRYQHAYNNRGFAEMHLNMPDKARADIGKSLAMDSANSYAWKNLGLLMLQLKKTDSACLLFKKAQALRYSEKYGSEVDSLIKVHCKYVN